MKKMLLALLAAAIIVVMLPAAMAQDAQTELYISHGAITIGDGTVSGKDSNGIDVTKHNPNGYIIRGSTISNTISVTGGTHDITLSGVNIDVSTTNYACAFSISPGAAVNLELEGTNTLKSGSGKAGLRVATNAELTINGSGSLEATGGDGGAGIGSNTNETCGTLTITSGTVEANGGENAAGIGGGWGQEGGSVTVEGGTVTATGGERGAGIGGGEGGGGGTVIITGGTVETEGGTFGAGIGGGESGSGGTVRIIGGSVKAFSIGAGSGGTDSGTLTNGTDPVYLTTLTLKDAGAGTPIDSLDAALSGNPYPYTMTDVKTINTNKLYLYLPENTVVNGVKTDENTKRDFKSIDAEIKTLTNGTASGTLTMAVNSPILNIHDGIITLSKSNETLCYTQGAGSLTPYTGEVTIISNGSTLNNYIRVTGGAHDITLNGVFIDVRTIYDTCAFSIDTGAEVNLTLVGSNELGSGEYCAGLQVPSGAILTIKGDGSLLAIGGNGAGIGGGWNKTCGEVTINGGTVNATSTGSGAGIGGGGGTYSGAGGKVNITGGTVTATGSNLGAGIGGGGGTYSGDGGEVNITGGTVTATGGDGGAGIGGGGGKQGGTGGNVYISGGSVKAVGGVNGASIGSGGSVSAPGAVITVYKEKNGNVPVYLTTLTLEGAAEGTPLASIDNIGAYGLNGVKTLDADKLYLYLPVGTTVNSAATGGTDPRVLYNVSATPITTTADHSTNGTLGTAAARVTIGATDKDYGSFDAAWAAATGATTATVKLLKNVGSANYASWPITVPENKTITLDLNGCDIDRGLTGKTANGNVITVNGNLTLMDSKVNGTGAIKGGYNAEFGGGVYINGGNFTMSGGEIKDNYAYRSGGGVSIYGGEFYMSKGKISNNYAGDTFDGVYVISGTVKVSGEPVIMDNQKYNIYLYNKILTIVGEGLKGGAKLGVYSFALPSSTASVPITGENSADYSGCFISDNEKYAVVNIGTGDKQVVKLAITTQVTLNHNDGTTLSETFTAVCGEAIPSGVTKPTRAGYEFEGYYTAADDSGVMVIDKDGAYVADADGYIAGGKWVKAGTAELFARWAANNCAIALDKNGGDADGSATAAYASPTLTNITHATRSYFALTGYFTEDIAGEMVINPNGELLKDVYGFTDAAGNWIYTDPSAILYAQWMYIPPADPAPVVIFDENGNPINCKDLQEALDKIAAGLKVKQIVLNSDQTIDGNLVIPDDIVFNLNGYALSCGTLTIGEGARFYINEGQVVYVTGASGEAASKAASGISCFTGIVNHGVIISKGQITLTGSAIEGNGMLEFEAGSVTLKGKSRLGKVTMAKGLTITIDGSFVRDLITGSIFLPVQCYEVGYKVVTFAGETNPANFWLGDMAYSDWYIDKQGCLAHDESQLGDIIPEYLVVGKNTKTNLANLLPWNFKGTVTWQTGDDKVLKIIKNGKKRLFKGVELGSTTLMAAFENGREQSIPVTVVAKKEAVSSVGGPNAIKLKRGETRQLTPKVKPGKAVDKALFWHSSDEKIATVENGLITGVNTGTCRVVAVSASGKRKVVKVTVTKKAVTTTQKRIVDEVTIG